jgi:hypothetical protein
VSAIDVLRPTRVIRPAALLVALLFGASAGAQYPLRPSPVIDPSTVTASPSIGGFLIARHTQHRDSATSVIRNARIGLRARPRPFVVVKVQGDLASAGRLSSDSSVAAFELTDAFLEFAPTDTTRWRTIRPTLMAGQFKQPFSLEYLTPDERLLTPDRSLAVDRISPRRDIGAMGQLDLGARATLQAAVANGEGPNARANPDGHELYTARLTVVALPGLALGGKIGAESSDHMWGYDARWIGGPAVIEGEYLHRRRGAEGAAASDAGGGYLMARYRVASWLQPVLKWERFEQTAPTVQRSTWLTAGANVATPSETVRAQLMLQHRDESHARGLTQLLAQLVVVY